MRREGEGEGGREGGRKGGRRGGRKGGRRGRREGGREGEDLCTVCDSNEKYFYAYTYVRYAPKKTYRCHLMKRNGTSRSVPV